MESNNLYQLWVLGLITDIYQAEKVLGVLLVLLPNFDLCVLFCRRKKNASVTILLPNSKAPFNHRIGHFGGKISLYSQYWCASQEKIVLGTILLPNSKVPFNHRIGPL